MHRDRRQIYQVLNCREVNNSPATQPLNWRSHRTNLSPAARIGMHRDRYPIPRHLSCRAVSNSPATSTLVQLSFQSLSIHPTYNQISSTTNLLLFRLNDLSLDSLILSNLLPVDRQETLRQRRHTLRLFHPSPSNLARPPLQWCLAIKRRMPQRPLCR